jgi:hypothetical protein
MGTEKRAGSTIESDDEVLRRVEAFGVDLSLLRERLAWTPTERLEWLFEVLEFVEALQTAGKRAHGEP